jgi:hypothetical protein
MSIFFVCFLKSGSDNAFWNFLSRTRIQSGSAISFGIIIYIGLCVAFYAIKSLFGDPLKGLHVYAHAATFCFVLFSPFYFMANILDKTAKYDDNIRPPDNAIKIFGVYVMPPLAAVYVVILYIYLFRIILSWDLPKGLVSWLVSALACGGLLTITLLYPVRQLEKNKNIELLSRWFGVVILPLLALMSIGIFRRINDYGITVMRAYLLLINIWFYGIYAYIFITKAKHIKWIIISAAALALLASVGPLSVANVTKRTLSAEIQKLLGDNKIPASGESPLYNMTSLHTNEDKAKVASKIMYLYTTYGSQSVARFFDGAILPQPDEEKRRFSYMRRQNFQKLLAEPQKKDPQKSFSYQKSVNDIYRTNKFNSLATIFYDQYFLAYREKVNCYVDNDQLIVDVIHINQKFNIPIREMAMRLLEDNDNKIELIVENDNYTLIINRILGAYNAETDEIKVRMFGAYLFYDR